MTLISSDNLFTIYPSQTVARQRIAVVPTEHHYEELGEKPYIKYSCPICEKIANAVKGKVFSDDDDYGKFVRFSFSQGTPNCPCCGINFDWRNL